MSSCKRQCSRLHLTVLDGRSEVQILGRSKCLLTSLQNMANSTDAIGWSLILLSVKSVVRRWSVVWKGIGDVGWSTKKILERIG